MIYLILSIISSVGIAVVIRFNEEKNLSRMGVMFVNYTAATILAFLFLPGKTDFENIPELIPLSTIAGFLFVSAFLIYMASVKFYGISLSVTVTRLSVVIPVLGSILVFSESINVYQLTGLLFALVSIYLFSSKPAYVSNPGCDKNVFLPVLLFLLIGFGDFSLKIFNETFGQASLISFTMLVFGFAAIYTLGLVLVKKIKISRNIIFGGIFLGIPNFFSAFFILKTLQHFSGAIAFPLNNIGIILLSYFIGISFWKEKLPPKNIFALVAAILAVLLLNMEKYR